MNINSWIRMIRIHTSCLTQAGILIGLILAGETDLIRIILFMFFAVIFHAVGFTTNNYYDYPYDKKDNAKKHFPLVSGEITLRQTRNFIIIGTVIGSILGLYLSNFRVLSIAFLVGAITFGWLYNYSSKFMPYAGPLWITISFTCIPLFSYFSVSYEWTLPLVFVVKYTFVLMFYQIAVEGYLKDITVPQANIFFKLGTKLKNGWIKHSIKSKLFMAKLVVLKLIITLIFLYYTVERWNLVQISIYATLFVIIIDISYELGKDMKYNNTEIVRNCAITEILTYLMLVTCLMCIIGWLWYIFFVVYPICWFIIWNRITWGTTIRPRV